MELKKEFITKELKSLSLDAEIELFPSTKDEMVIYDLQEGKEQTYRYPSSMTKEWMETKLLFGPRVKKIIDLSKLADQLLLWIDKNSLITLQKLIFIMNEEDMEYIHEQLNDEHLIDCIDLEHEIGKTIWYRDICFINVGKIYELANEIGVDEHDIQKEFMIGLWTTIIHELRHLMLDGNIILPEVMYPIYYSAEENVEKYCLEFFELINRKKDFNLYQGLI